jgi:Tol biopolymer transport system component
MSAQFRVLVRLVAAVACALLVVPVAEASFPGGNGVIAFVREVPPFSQRGDREGAATLWAVDPRSDRVRQLTHVPRRCRRRGWTWTDLEPSFSASGRLLIYYHADRCERRTPNGLYAMRADGSARRLILREDEREILEWASFSPSGRSFIFTKWLDYEVEGTFITSVRRPHRRTAVRVGCLSFRRCPEPQYSVPLWPAWSSTGRLAVTLRGYTPTAETGHIGTVDANGRGFRLVTRSRRDAMPDWSPTANRIVFQRQRRGRADLHTAAADGHSNGDRPRPSQLATAARAITITGWISVVAHRQDSKRTAARSMERPTPPFGVNAIAHRG